MELFNKVTAGRLALPEKVRVNLLALGDVGSTLLLGLRLMGGDVISSMGICDVRENAALRWEFELNQIQPPSGAGISAMAAAAVSITARQERRCRTGRKPSTKRSFAQRSAMSGSCSRFRNAASRKASLQCWRKMALWVIYVPPFRLFWRWNGVFYHIRSIATLPRAVKRIPINIGF